MNEQETEAAIVALQTENEELRERVADLEMRVARGHSHAIDLCRLDDDGECMLGERHGWDE